MKLLVAVAVVLATALDALACPGINNLSCLGVKLDGERAEPYSGVTIRQIGDPVSPDPSFWYEILDDRGVNLLGRIAGTTLQLQRWSTELQTWVLEYYAVSNLPQDPFPLLPQTEYRFSELPALLTVRDFYGTKLDQVPPLSVGEYRVAFSIVADRAG